MVTKPTVRTHSNKRPFAAARQRTRPVLHAVVRRLRQATASGLFVNLLVLAVTLAVVALTLRQIASRDAVPSEEVRQRATAPIGVEQSHRAMQIGADPAPARTSPVYYIVDSDEQAAMVEKEITDALPLAQDFGGPVDHQYADASVVRVSPAEGLDQISLDVITGNGYRLAAGLPLARVVDLRAGAGDGRSSYQRNGLRRYPESMTVEIEPCVER